MNKIYTINKFERSPKIVSYNGICWKIADIKHLRKDFYQTFNEAEEICRILNSKTETFFKVSTFVQKENEFMEEIDDELYERLISNNSNVYFYKNKFITI